MILNPDDELRRSAISVTSTLMKLVHFIDLPLKQDQTAAVIGLTQVQLTVYFILLLEVVLGHSGV